MELASLLGDERFSDHPARVCAVLSAFLRGYNDATSPRRRQDLFRLAAVVVDSRVRDDAVRAERADELIAHALNAWRTRGWRFAFPPSFESRTGFCDVEAAGAYVGRLARRDEALHARTAALIEQLVVRARPAVAPEAPPASRALIGEPADHLVIEA